LNRNPYDAALAVILRVAACSLGKPTCCSAHRRLVKEKWMRAKTRLKNDA
jgi:hypothetical protein